MKDTEVPRSVLLDALRENRIKHSAQFEEADREYRIEWAKWARKQAKLCSDGYEYEQYSHLPKPSSHKSEYDVAIQMLEHDTREIIKLQADEFKQYVLDMWRWKSDFSETIARYSKAVG